MRNICFTFYICNTCRGINQFEEEELVTNRNVSKPTSHAKLKTNTCLHVEKTRVVRRKCQHQHGDCWDKKVCRQTAVECQANRCCLHPKVHNYQLDLPHQNQYNNENWTRCSSDGTIGENGEIVNVAGDEVGRASKIFTFLGKGKRKEKEDC
jgi:hypothetical protein